jgi:hypothetical protein
LIVSENVVWNSTLDGRYKVTVVRTGRYQADLSIQDGEQILHGESVGLAYDALFGPDVDDVDRWQQIAVNFVDKLGLSKD